MDGTKIKIRLATSDDLLEVASCARAAYSWYIERIGREPAPIIANFAEQIDLGQVYVAHFKLTFIGYAVFYSSAKHLHLENVAVAPSYMGQGVGKRLIEYAEQTARNKGLKAVELYTNETMTENLAMYPRLGYIETERKHQAGFNRVFFRKNI